MYVAAEGTGLFEQMERQRKMILAQSDVLCDLGFDPCDFGDIADCLEAETETPPPKRGWSVVRKVYGVSTLSYLLLNLLSPRVPGPAAWIGVGRHVHLLLRVTRLW